MAKAVPVRVTLSEQTVDMACLRKSLENLHICVVAEVIQEDYSEQQVAALLIAMQKKLLENRRRKERVRRKKTGSAFWNECGTDEAGN